MLDQVEANRPGPARRLREAREAAGYDTASKFARYIGVNYTSYHRHESGKSPIPEANAKVYAEALNLTPSALMFGEELRVAGPVPIVGIIGAGGKISAMDTSDHITLATSVELVGHIVHGNDLYPAFRHGDVVFTRPLSRKRFNPVNVHGQECVCEIENGDLILREVSMQADGRATLIAPRATPLYNINLLAAEPVEMIKRRPGAMLG